MNELKLFSNFQNFGRLRNVAADRDFETDGVDLFSLILDDKHITNLNQSGQMAVRDLLKSYLQRIERDAKGQPIRLKTLLRIYNVETLVCIKLSIREM